MSGIAAWRQWNVPVRFTAIMAFHASRVMSVNAANAAMPALVTMIATGPSSRRTAASAPSTADAVRHVDRAPERLHAAAAQVVGGVFGRVAFEVEDRDPVPPLAEVACHRLTDAGSTAGDDRDTTHDAPSITGATLGTSQLENEMVTHEENELLTRIDGNAPMGRLMRDHYWVPFALTSQLVAGAGPMPVRLFGENYVAFRAESGRIGFFDELCPHRRASLVLARAEGDCLRCIYHGWKLDVAGCVVEAPTQQVRPERFAASVPVVHFPVHESGGLAWVWLGGVHAPPFPELPFAAEDLHSFWCVSRVPCNWLQGVEGTIDSAHVGVLHHTWLSKSAEVEGYGNITPRSTSSLRTRPRSPRTACAPPRSVRRRTARPTCG